MPGLLLALGWGLRAKMVTYLLSGDTCCEVKLAITTNPRLLPQADKAIPMHPQLNCMHELQTLPEAIFHKAWPGCNNQVQVQVQAALSHCTALCSHSQSSRNLIAPCATMRHSPVPSQQPALHHSYDKG